MKKKSLFLSTLISSCIIAFTSGQGYADMTQHPYFPTNRGMSGGSVQPYDPSGGAPIYTPSGMCPGGQCGQPSYGMPGSQMMPQDGMSGMPGRGMMQPGGMSGYKMMPQGGSSYMQSPSMYGAPQQYGTQSRGTWRWQLPGYQGNMMDVQNGYTYSQGSPSTRNGQKYGSSYGSSYGSQNGYGYGNGYGKYSDQTNGDGSRALQTGSTEKISGTIQSINRVQYPDGTRTEIVVNTDEGTKKITLGPSSFIETQRIKIQSGDRVTLNAYKVGANGEAVYVAQDISKNGNTIQLRDQSRKPMWQEGSMNGNTQMRPVRGTPQPNGSGYGGYGGYGY